MNKLLPTVLVALLVALPLAYLTMVYPSLPATIPTHFGFDGKPNGFSDKKDMILIVVSVSILSVLVYLLIRYLPRIDPKKTASLSAGNMQKIAVAVVALMSAVTISILYSSQHGMMSFNRLFNPLIGIFFIVVGNWMYNIKPNYFVGIRVPWTLESPDNWRATHRMGSKLWVAGGILITICSPFLAGKTAEYFFMATTLGLALIPIIYSFLYFKNNRTAA
jgi:immunity protein, SdpI family